MSSVCDFFRDGYKGFFDRLAEQQVPLLIFSAGVGDVLEEVIRQNRVFHPNVRVISNYMDFDQTVSLTTPGLTGISYRVHYCMKMLSVIFRQLRISSLSFLKR